MKNQSLLWMDVRTYVSVNAYQKNMGQNKQTKKNLTEKENRNFKSFSA